jgi:iron complex transport system ATP-binding protein
MRYPSPLLTTQNLAIGYGKNFLWRDLSLSLLPGQLICFMGPNGIGKSTLIRTLAGLQPPLQGTIRRYAASEQSAVSVVLTDRLNAGFMTVYELVAFGRYPYIRRNLKLRKNDREIIGNAIDMVKIGQLTHKKLHELSDGQLQLAMIARALAQDTGVILLDEPTAHLDLNNRVEIMNLLRRMAHSFDKSVLVATHELDLALQTADAIWLAGGDDQFITGIPEDLILNGTFDKIFQLKGFDLRTGQVAHTVSLQDTVKLSGSGFEYRWTRNAIERVGYPLVENNARFTIAIVHDENKQLTWKVDGAQTFSTIGSLLEYLKEKQGNSTPV